MPGSSRNDPYKNYNFLVEIDSVTVAGFSEVSGIGSEVDVIEYREGGDHLVRKLPGLRKFQNIILKRGITRDAELWDWHKNILDGVSDRRNGVITLLDDARVAQVRWKFFDAFPQKYEGPLLRAKGNDVAIETLTLCCERIERENS
jgi:phage tail-like protein